MTDSSNFYKNGLNFSCKRCSFCCGHSPGFVYLSKYDLDRLCNFFNMSISDFVKKYCRWADYYYGEEVLALLEKQNYDCILWENGCSAYQARPVQCSAYPFWSWMIRDQKTWNECASDCPGMNNGKLWSFEEIEENRKNYDSNKPLTKQQVLQLIEQEKKNEA